MLMLQCSLRWRRTYRIYLVWAAAEVEIEEEGVVMVMISVVTSAPDKEL
jgi:hypothetical protein